MYVYLHFNSKLFNIEIQRCCFKKQFKTYLMAKNSEKQDLFLIYQYFPIVHQCVCANSRL